MIILITVISNRIFGKSIKWTINDWTAADKLCTAF